MSAYDDNASILVKLGYHPLPIGPGTKKPQRLVGSGYCDLTGWADPGSRPETSPQPGAGLAVRTGKQPDGTFVVALDWDNDNAFIAAMDDAKIWSPVQKIGKRGGTTFHRSSREIPSRDFKIAGKIAVQVLAQGKQTVLPPTIHPETGKPYTYGDDRATLQNCPASQLPALPDDYIERIEAILQPLGYEPEPESKPEVKANGHDPSDDTFRDLNNKALHSLALWVPDLGLQRCKRRRGPHASYDAVAEWREGSLPFEDRPFNLSIYPSGIRDFGTNEGYTPIDLVMAALNSEFGDAVEWLRERVLPKVDVVWDALKSAPAADEPKQEERTGDKADNDATQPGQKPRKFRFKLTRWCDMRPGTEQTYLVDELIPIKGIVVLWSPPKSFKSFVALDISLHVALGWEYHDRAVQQGLVVYCAFEGGHGFDKRIEAQRQYYNLEGQDLPMPVLKGMANLITDHKLMVHEIAYQLKTEYDGAKPVAVVLDTLNRSFVGSESKDTDMANYVRAAEAIRAAFDCVCIIIHHCGWDESRPRGHSSLPAAVDAQLSLVRDEDRATLTVEYMRDGVEGTQVLLMKKTIVIGEDDNGKEKTSLVMVRADDDVDTGAVPNKRREWPASLQIFHKAVTEAMREHGFNHQLLSGVLVRAVDLAAAHGVFFKTYVTESDDARRKAWKRALDSAQLKGLISARNEGHREIIWFTAREDDSHAL
jgi:hypothetical protein